MDTEGLSVICAGLGIAEEDENGERVGYSKGEYCLDNIKDLLRFLRRDDPENRDVFKQVCKWNIVSKDLIPIIEYCQDDHNLVLNAVKVLVFLTMPIELTSTDITQQIEYLWGLKSSITNSDVVAVILSLLEGPLENLESGAFTEDDWKLVQLVLTLFRNFLAVQEISLQQRAVGSASQFLSLRDGFLELLFRENVMDLILVITQHVGGSYSYLRQDNLLLLEIFHYIFMGQDPELIAKAYLKHATEDDDVDASVDSLKSIMEEEKRRLSRQRDIGRHSQFSGTFTRLSLDGSKAVLKGKPTLDSLHKPLRVCHGRIKRIPWDLGQLPSTKDKILQLLHDFVNQFLQGGYNALMKLVHEDIVKEYHGIQNNDIVIFFHVAQFTTSFQYHKFLASKPMEADTNETFTDSNADSTNFRGDICGPIAATMNESMFQLVILKWRHAFDGLKETNDFKFLSAAGSLMKNMIRILDLVLKLLPEDSKEPQTARVLLYKLFYDQTDQGMTQFLLNLIKSFDTHKQGKSDLADLVEMIYKVVKLMEKLQARGTLRVSRKSRKVRKTKLSNDKENKQLEDHSVVKEIGISSSERLTDASVNKNSDTSSIDFDGKDDTRMPTQVEEHSIPVKDVKEMGVSSSERLTDTGVNKNSDTSTMGFDGKDNTRISTQVEEHSIPMMDVKSFPDRLLQMDDKNIDNAYSTGDSSGDEDLAAITEVDFKVSSLISAFASNNIVQKLCWLLKFYKINSTSTNHYILCMLRRITDDLELSPMLYQLSLLTIFYDILVDQKSNPRKEYANIVDFLKSFVRKMLRKMKNQPLLFVELLFWKNRKECHYINAEYMLHELGSLKKESRNWENVPGGGENGSSTAKGCTFRSIADALGEDEADVVIHHELVDHSSEDKFRVADGGLAFVSDGELDQKEHNDNGGESMNLELKRPLKRNKRLVLDEMLESRIRDLYEKFKDDHNCSRLIAEVLDPDGKVLPAQVSNKLKQLGLKVDQRKRMRYTKEAVSVDANKFEGDNRKGETSGSHKSNDLEESLLSRPLHTRKRVRAFSEDQEAKIRSLYEQFKDHVRCSYMIANALDPDSKFSTAQVSRKLKQLGLRTSHQNRHKSNLQLRDEDLNDPSTDKEHESDNETLFSLINRKRRNRFPELKDKKITANLTQDTSIRDKSEDVAPESIMHLEDNNQSCELEPMSDGQNIPFNEVDVDGSAETEFKVTGSEDALDTVLNNPDHLTYQQVDNELADSEDEAPISNHSSATTRRKLSMVVDLEDDD